MVASGVWSTIQAIEGLFHDGVERARIGRLGGEAPGVLLAYHEGGVNWVLSNDRIFPVVHYIFLSIREGN